MKCFIERKRCCELLELDGLLMQCELKSCFEVELQSWVHFGEV